MREGLISFTYWRERNRKLIFQAFSGSAEWNYPTIRIDQFRDLNESSSRITSTTSCSFTYALSKVFDSYTLNDGASDVEATHDDQIAHGNVEIYEVLPFSL